MKTAYEVEVNGKKAVITVADIKKDFRSLQTAATPRHAACGKHVALWLGSVEGRKQKDFAQAFDLSPAEVTASLQIFRASTVIPWVLECTLPQAKAWGRAIEGKGGKGSKRVKTLEVTFEE